MGEKNRQILIFLLPGRLSEAYRFTCGLTEPTVELIRGEPLARLLEDHGHEAFCLRPRENLKQLVSRVFQILPDQVEEPGYSGPRTLYYALNDARIAA